MLTDDKWNLLLRRIAYERCTPFLGADVGSETLPRAWEIARSGLGNIGPVLPGSRWRIRPPTE